MSGNYQLSPIREYQPSIVDDSIDDTIKLIDFDSMKYKKKTSKLSAADFHMHDAELHDIKSPGSNLSVLRDYDSVYIQLFLEDFTRYVHDGGDDSIHKFINPDIANKILIDLRESSYRDYFRNAEFGKVDSEVVYLAMTEKYNDLDSMSFRDAINRIKLSPSSSIEQISDYCRRFILLSEFFQPDKNSTTDFERALLNGFLRNIQPLALQHMVRSYKPQTLREAIQRLKESSTMISTLLNAMGQAIDSNPKAMDELLPPQLSHMTTAFNQSRDPLAFQNDAQGAEDEALRATKLSVKLLAEAKKADDDARIAAEKLVRTIKEEAEKDADNIRKTALDEIRKTLDDLNRQKALAQADADKAKEEAKRAKEKEAESFRRASEIKEVAESLLAQAKDAAAKELEDARNEADRIIDDAEKRAQEILADAEEVKRDADQLKEDLLALKDKADAAARAAKEKEEKAKAAIAEAEMVKAEQAEKEKARLKAEADMLAAKEAARREAEEAKRKRDDEERARLKAEAELQAAKEAALKEAAAAKKKRDDEELARKKKSEMEALQARLLAEAVKKQLDDVAAADAAMRAKQEREALEKERAQALTRAQRDEEAKIALAKSKMMTTSNHDVTNVDANAVNEAMKSLPIRVDVSVDDSTASLSSPMSKRSQSPMRRSWTSRSVSRGQSPGPDKRSQSFSLASDGWNGETRSVRGYTPKLYTFGKLGFDFPPSPSGASLGDLRCCSYRFCSCKFNYSPKAANLPQAPSSSEEAKSPEIRYLQELSNEIPSLNRISKILEQLINVFMNLKCNKKSGESFAVKLQKVATVLTRLFKSYRQFNQSEVKTILDELGETLLEAKKYFLPFTRLGFTLALLNGVESKQKLDDYDATVCRSITDIASVFVATNDSRNSIQPSEYAQYVVMDESALQLAGSDANALKALSRLITADHDDLVKDVPYAIHRLQLMREEIDDAGVQRVLQHPAMKTFWRLHLNDVYKLPLKQLVDISCGYVRRESTDINEDDLNLISNKLHETLEIFDYNSSGSVTVFLINQMTKHLDCSLSFVAVLERLWSLQTLKVIPSVSFKARDQIVWGEATSCKKIQQTYSSASSGCWSLVYGHRQVGKSYRYLVSAHEMDTKNAVIWIDCHGCQTTNDFLSSLSSQLSLCVLSLDDVILEFLRLLRRALYASGTYPGSPKSSPKGPHSTSSMTDSDSSWKQPHCSVILDHVDMNHLEPLTPLLKALKGSLQGPHSVSVVMITTDSSKPSASSVNELVKSGQVSLPYSSIRYIEIPALSIEDGNQLACYFDVYDASLLAQTAKGLPGNIRSWSGLRASQLNDIDRDPKSASQATMEMFSNDEMICATCLYHPFHSIPRDTPPSTPSSPFSSPIKASKQSQLNDSSDSLDVSNSQSANFEETSRKIGIVFNKTIAWELCRRGLNNNLHLFNVCLDRLIRVGWINNIDDVSMAIPSLSIVPVYCYHPTIELTSSAIHDVYYTHLINQTTAINTLLQTKDQILGCYQFDCIHLHIKQLFQSIENHFCPFDNAVPQSSVKELVGQLSNNITNILDYRILPESSLDISKSILRILCDGDDTGLLPDNRYWVKSNDFRYQGIVIRAVINFGWYLFRTNQLLYAEKVLTMAINHLGEPDGVNYAYALNKLAIVLRALGRSEESLQIHEKCLWLRVAIVGEKHQDTAQSLNNIAIVLNALGHVAEGLAIHERCLAIRLDLLGNKHPHTGDTYYNMAGALVTLKRYDEALSCFEKAKEAYMSTYGEDHGYVQDVSNQIELMLQQKRSNK